MVLDLYTPDPDKRTEKEMVCTARSHCPTTGPGTGSFEALGVSTGMHVGGNIHSLSEFDYVPSCQVTLSGIFI